MGRRQVVRQRTLTPPFAGSNPSAPVILKIYPYVMTVKIQFIRGINEPVIPEIRLTKSNNASTGTAIFQFKNPKIFLEEVNVKKTITGMYLIDSEGIIITKRLITYFINGKPEILEAIYIIRNTLEWERLTRFLTRFSESNNLTFIQSEKN